MQLIGNKKNSLKAVWVYLLDCLFPKKCFGCQNEGEYLCSACFDKIELAGSSCYLCQAKSAERGICVSCRQKSQIDQIIVATPYDNNVAGVMVEALKYNYIEELAFPLSQLIYRRVQKLSLLASLQQKIFVPIPLHRKRMAERGFNQSELLTAQLAKLFQGVVKNDILKRIRYTKQQAKLTRSERLANMKESFMAISKELPSSVVLVDDVITTGSTIIAATKALKKVGVKEVIALAVCHG